MDSTASTTNTELTAMTIDKGQSSEVWALIPVKSLKYSKQRLTNVLSSQQRAQLTVAMFKDVLSALSGSVEVNQVVVITADQKISAIAQDNDMLVIDEQKSSGMNQAIQIGIDSIKGLGASQVAIIPADLPLLTAVEIDRVLDEIKHARCVCENRVVGIGVSQDGAGTNFLCVDVEQPLKLSYGEQSFQRHIENTKDINCDCVSLHSEKISLDIDSKKDLKMFLDRCVSYPENKSTWTWKYLQSIGYVDKPDTDK